MSYYQQHQETLDRAILALRNRTFFAQYPEFPSPKIYGETADEDGRNIFQKHLANKFDELLQPEPSGWIGEEESPYMQQPLNIQYPQFEIDQLISRAQVAFDQWRKVSPKERAGLLVESLERVKDRFFELAYATMHTTGQGFMMAFQASGPHAADRALEAVSLGLEEQLRIPEKVRWEKPMGKYQINLLKEWRLVPKGISLVIGCSTFPTWNSVPGIYASLVAGNPVLVKPHPGAVLPIALFVSEVQKVLKESGLDPQICQLVVDTFASPVAKTLAEHPEVKLIDFTGNSEFGSYLEGLPGKVVFTEKTGVNSVILDSVTDIDKVAQNLGFSLSLYSGQMCTAPQNIYIPKAGIKTPEGSVSLSQFAEKLSESINGLLDNPKAGPFVTGAVQNRITSERVADAEKMDARVLLKSRAIENPMFENARTATPVLLQVESSQKQLYGQELFGPIALLISTKNTDESIELASEQAKLQGAISCGAYTTDPEVREKIADQMSLVATPVSFNLTGGIYLNQHAGFSDFHVTGGNPAGNASFTNPEFVVKRFTVVGMREPVG
ncbi:MAG: oxidoreductase [Cyclobacteriaceae bacterium]|nr:MAG: oxidoreductase [Cyclobacteriaceae bacterium]